MNAKQVGAALFLLPFLIYPGICLTLSAYIVVQPIRLASGLEATVSGAPPFIEPTRSLFEPPLRLNTSSE